MNRTIYLHGFASGPQSSKGQFFHAKFAERGWPLELPDLTEGDFENTTLSRQLGVLDRLAGAGPVILVGSSMGGYLAALFAARRPERVQAVVLLAPAFGMAKRWAGTLDAATLRDWKERGWREVYHYGEKQNRRISYQLIEDGMKYEDFPAVRQPALVIHGRRDETVDYRLSEQFAGGHENIRLVLYDSDHQLLDVLEGMWWEVCTFIEAVPEVDGRPVRNPPDRVK